MKLTSYYVMLSCLMEMGVDATKIIKDQYPTVEIILLTAYGNIPDGVQAIKMAHLII